MLWCSSSTCCYGVLVPLECAIHPCNAFRGSSHQLKTPPAISALDHPPPPSTRVSYSKDPHYQGAAGCEDGVEVTTKRCPCHNHWQPSSCVRCDQNFGQKPAKCCEKANEKYSEAKRVQDVPWYQGQGQAKWWLCGEAPHSTSVVRCGRTVWWYTVVVVRQELSHYLVTGTKWPPPPHCCHYLVRFSIKIKLPTFQLESILRKWI